MKKILFLGLCLASFCIHASQRDYASKDATEELNILGKYGSSWSREGQAFCDGMPGLYPDIVYTVVSERDYPRRLFSASIVPGKHLEPVQEVVKKEEKVPEPDQQRADEEFAQMVALADERLKRCPTVVRMNGKLSFVLEERGSESDVVGMYPNSTCAVGEGPRNLSDISLPLDGSFGFNDKVVASSSPQRVDSGNDVAANQAPDLVSHHISEVHQPSLLARLCKMFSEHL